MPKIVHRETRRSEIVDAATRVFATRGYHAARMEDVSAALGISKGLLYQSFATKEDLFMQVCLTLVPWKDLSSADAGPEQRVRDLIAAIVARYEESQNFFLILSDFWTAAMRGPNAKRAALLATGAQFYVPVRAALIAAIRDGQRTGVFAADADAATLANLAIAAIEGVRLQHQLDPRAARKTRVVAAVADLLLQGLTHGQTTAGVGTRKRTRLT
ncbi:MAG: TetR/AcrR family transcriptional regulator [Candidatus Binatia bacterium]